MSRRARAIGFGCLALVCAGLAAALAGGYRSGVEDQLGDLRSVVVAREDLPPGKPLGPADASRLLEVRRVPERFVPAGALSAPEQALGREPAARVPAGSYLVVGQLRAPRRPHPHRRPELSGGREPVELQVSGAEALAGASDQRAGRVDVVVTTEPGPGGGEGRTYVAAKGVELLALRQSDAFSPDGGLSEPGPTFTATLALSRTEALHLIQADNFARQIRLIRHTAR